MNLAEINKEKNFVAGATQISSSKLNNMLATLKALAGGRPEGQSTGYINSDITVKGLTDIEPLQVFGIGDTVEYEADTVQFENTLIVTGEAIDPLKHYNRYGISLDNIKEEGYGDGVSTGYCVCKVDIRNVEHKEAEVQAGSVHLKSTVNGTSSIIWKETDTTGVQYCIINLNDNINNGVIISNAYGQSIPANGVMKATLKSGERNWYDVTRPDTDNQTNILILDDFDLQAGGTKKLIDKQQHRFLIDFSPSAGDNAGAQAGSFTAKKGNTGLKCYGGSGGTAEGRFFSSGAWSPLALASGDVSWSDSFSQGDNVAFDKTSSWYSLDKNVSSPGGINLAYKLTGTIYLEMSGDAFGEVNTDIFFEFGKNDSVVTFTESLNYVIGEKFGSSTTLDVYVYNNTVETMLVPITGSSTEFDQVRIRYKNEISGSSVGVLDATISITQFNLISYGTI